MPQDTAQLDSLRSLCAVSRKARLLLSSEVASPMAVGYMRPAIVLPENLLARLSPEEREHVLLHELAHIARYDDWTKLVSRFINALLGLHPIAAFVLSQIEKERELACDDWVVASMGDARAYAASLAHVFELSRG
jgi:beta-lactamase regulating signal transducer with metallopeptidase domain